MITRAVPFFSYPNVFTSQEGTFLGIFRDVGRRGAFILQEDLSRFEKNLARFLGVQHVLGVGNATDGLHIAVRAAGIGRGDEVIFSSHTMVATAAAIHFAGAVPVPVECGPDHLMDPRAAEAAITSRTRAIMPTQLNGRVCDMDALQNIANRHNVTIVEDAAQALGARFKGRCAGTFGAAAALSFYPSKALGCFGDGGAVLTNNEEIWDRMTQLRDHGRNRQGETVSWGLNSRLDNLQAAILDFGLKQYDCVMGRRRQLACTYTERLRDLADLVLPPGPDSDPDHFDIYQNYEIEAERRDGLKAYLKDRGIGTHIPWGGMAVHQFPGLGFKQALPFIEKLFARIVLLPMNMGVSDDDIEYICDSIRGFYGR